MIDDHFDSVASTWVVRVGVAPWLGPVVVLCGTEATLSGLFAGAESADAAGLSFVVK
jgi:hypothetical protein